MQSILQNFKITDALSLGFVIVSFIIPWYFYSELPDQIPSHFNAKGVPDAYSGKTTIWVLPIISLLTFLLLQYLSGKKDLTINTIGSNHKLSPTEKAYQIKQGRKLLITLKLIISVDICYIVYGSIQIGLGEAKYLSSFFLLTFLTVLFGVIVYYMYRMANFPKDL